MRAYLLAIRPRTLTAAIIPVAVGSALAARDQVFAPLPALVALLGALLIQAGTNLVNDAWDFRRGADTGARLGPVRVTQRGLLTAEAVLRAAWVCFGAATLAGLYLTWVGGLPIFAIGLASIAAAYLYTGGPYPLAYRGLGDAFVLLFFGFVAVTGTYYLQAQRVSVLALIASVPVGLSAVALLAVNNLRDRDTDAAADKRTLVVRFGARFGRAEYFAAVGVALLIPLSLFALGHLGPWALLVLLSTPFLVRPLTLVFQETGASLNAALHQTALWQLVFGTSFALALGLPGFSR